jgi:excinuclease UvrABC nuclease subunit
MNKNSFSFQNPLRARFGDLFFQNIPQNPGIYIMLSKESEPLYIGKAKCLKNRVKQYANAKPGTMPERILEMMEITSKIEWRICRTEQEAILLENEYLHAIRPPFNIASTEAEHYLFIGVKKDPTKNNFQKNSKKSPLVRINFQLSSRRALLKNEYLVFGCFKHRPKIKSGYTALMRLIYACTHENQRFQYPAKISRVSPPWIYSAQIPLQWEEKLHHFLKGKSKSLLHLIFNQLLENEFIPPFMHPSLQEDLETVQTFFRIGPQHNYRMKKKHGLKTQIITHQRMDMLIRSELNVASNISLSHSSFDPLHRLI